MEVRVEITAKVVHIPNVHFHSCATNFRSKIRSEEALGLVVVAHFKLSFNRLLVGSKLTHSDHKSAAKTRERRSGTILDYKKSLMFRSANGSFVGCFLGL